MGFDWLAGPVIFPSPPCWTSRAALQSQPAPGGGLRQWAQPWHHWGLSNRLCLFPVPETQVVSTGMGTGFKISPDDYNEQSQGSSHWNAPDKSLVS